MWSVSEAQVDVTRGVLNGLPPFTSAGQSEPTRRELLQPEDRFRRQPPQYTQNSGLRLAVRKNSKQLSRQYQGHGPKALRKQWMQKAQSKPGYADRVKYVFKTNPKTAIKPLMAARTQKIAQQDMLAAIEHVPLVQQPQQQYPVPSSASSSTGNTAKQMQLHDVHSVPRQDSALFGALSPRGQKEVTRLRQLLRDRDGDGWSQLRRNEILQKQVKKLHADLAQSEKANGELQQLVGRLEYTVKYIDADAKEQLSELSTIVRQTRKDSALIQMRAETIESHAHARKTTTVLVDKLAAELAAQEAQVRTLKVALGTSEGAAQFKTQVMLSATQKLATSQDKERVLRLELNEALQAKEEALETIKDLQQQIETLSHKERRRSSIKALPTPTAIRNHKVMSQLIATIPPTPKETQFKPQSQSNQLMKIDTKRSSSSSSSMYNFVSSPAGTTHHKKSELEALLTVEKRKVTMLQHQLRGLADENQAFDEATVQLKHDLAEKTSALTRLEYESAQVESSDILKDSAFRDLQRKQHSLQATLENVQKDAAFERKQKGILVGVLRLWLSLEQEKRVLKAQATALHETMIPDIGVVFADDSAVLGKIPSTSALARAGLKRGDRLLSVNGHAISTAEEFLTLAVDFKVGSTLDLHALRKKTNNSMGGSNMYSKPFQSGGGGNTGDVNGDAFQVLVQAKGYPIEAQQLISQVSQTENSNNLEVWCAEIKREGETWMQDAVKTAQPWESFAKQGISL